MGKMKEKHNKITDEQVNAFIFEAFPFIEQFEGYYTEQFSKIKRGKKITWNWSAFIYGPLWCAYRKMYAMGILHILVNELFILLELSIYVNMVWYIIFSMFANTIYMKIIEERIKEKLKLDEVGRNKYQKEHSGVSIIATVIFLFIIIGIRVIYVLPELGL